MEFVNGISDRELAFKILNCIQQSGKMNKGNLLRKCAGIPSHLEQFCKKDFDQSTTQRANVVLQKLERDGLIAPSFADAINPLDWMVLTESGRKAIESKCLDALDSALVSIDEGVVATRDQMWSCYHSIGQKKNFVACHAARELIDQILRVLAPNELVVNEEWFIPNLDSESKVTRGHRIEYILRRRMAQYSQEYCDGLRLCLPKRLYKEAHLVQVNDNNEYIYDLLLDAEGFLKKLLIYSQIGC